jgi:DNA-binding CsgD family transcriptional regulator
MHAIDPGETGSLDDLTIAGYRHALSRGAYVVDDVVDDLSLDRDIAMEIRRRLLDLRLLCLSDDEGPAVPVSPEVAELELTAPLEHDIRQHQQLIRQIHNQLRPLTAIYTDERRLERREGSVRSLRTAAEVRREILAAAARCTDEVLTMQPGGGRNPDTLRDAIDRDLSILARGAKIRTIYQHTATASLATRTYVSQITDKGGQVRTTTGTFDRLLIFDSAIAFIPMARQHGNPPGAALVQDATIVEFARRVFENHWAVSIPFALEPDARAETLTEVQEAILKLMASGMKDDVIARRLGMATRTCRRYITTLMEELGATSRFQAGVRAAQLGLLPGDEPADGPVIAPDAAAP